MPSDVVVGSAESWRAVGRQVLLRRTQELGVTQADLSGGDLSVTSIGKIEAGRAESYRGRTIRALECALGWRSGSVQRILGGREPLLARPEEPTLDDVVRSTVTTPSGLDVEYAHRPGWSPERQIAFEELVSQAADLVFGKDLED